MQSVNKFTYFRCFRYVFISYNILLFFFLGIPEAIFVAKYESFEKDCQSIWSWILAAAILNMLVPLCTLFSLYKFCNTNDNKKIYLINLLHISQFIIALWSAITYYNINKSCYSFWISNAPELWTFVVIHLVMMWISIAILFVIVCSICMCYCCYRFYSSPSYEDAIAGQSYINANNVNNVNNNPHLNSYGSLHVNTTNNV